MMTDPISVKDAAEVIGCTLDMTRYFLRTGRLASVKIGGGVLIERADVEEFAEARRVYLGEKAPVTP